MTDAVKIDLTNISEDMSDPDVRFMAEKFTQKLSVLVSSVHHILLNNYLHECFYDFFY